MASPEERRSRPTLRLYLVGLIALALFAVMGLRLWSLQVINQKTYAAAVSGNTLRVASVQAPRGEIVDRNGTILVGNTTSQEIVFSRAEAQQHPASVGQVAALVGETPAQIRQALNNQQYSPFEPVPVMENAPPATVQYIEAHQSQYPGVSVRSVTERTYPQGGTIATPILGYVTPITGQELQAHRNDGYTTASQYGQTGLESEYQPVLRGRDGKQYLEVNAKGEVVGTDRTVRPNQGDTLVTNLDTGLQNAVNAALVNDINADRQTVDATTGNKPAATNGAAVVLDAQTGAVLAMASYPTYDLNQWVGGISQAEYQALQAACPSGAAGAQAGCPLINYAIQGRYTPGSTFKMVTATAALQRGLVDASYIYNDTGTFTVPGCTGGPTGCTFHDDDNAAAGSINITQALTVSSDDFFYNLGVMFWDERNIFGDTPIQDTAAQYGEGQLTGIDLPDESQGMVDSLALRTRLYNEYPRAYDKPYWSSGANLELAFGQGSTVLTPIEQAQAFATFANGGTRYQPQVANAVVSPDGRVVWRFQPKVLGHVSLPPNVYGPILTGLEGVVNDPSGTAYGTFQADAAPAVHALNLAGKTGTADVSQGEPNAWFVSFGPNLPGQPPKYVVLAVVQQAGYGAQAAAPAVAQIWNYLATNPVGGVQLPVGSKQPSPTPPPTNPPAGTPPPVANPAAPANAATPAPATPGATPAAGAGPTPTTAAGTVGGGASAAGTVGGAAATGAAGASGAGGVSGTAGSGGTTGGPGP